jgi:hypothetical protein
MKIMAHSDKVGIAAGAFVVHVTLMLLTLAETVPVPLVTVQV